MSGKLSEWLDLHLSFLVNQLTVMSQAADFTAFKKKHSYFHNGTMTDVNPHKTVNQFSVFKLKPRVNLPTPGVITCTGSLVMLCSPLKT